MTDEQEQRPDNSAFPNVLSPYVIPAKERHPGG